MYIAAAGREGNPSIGPEAAALQWSCMLAMPIEKLQQQFENAYTSSEAAIPI